LSDLGRYAHQDHLRTKQSSRLSRPQQVVGNLSIDNRYTGDIDNHGIGALLADCSQQRLRDLLSAHGIDRADQRQNQRPLADRNNWA